MDSRNVIILFIIYGASLHAQMNHNLWYINNDIVLDFSVGQPIYRQEMHNLKKRGEASVVVTTEQGKLLFYTDGGRIWNREHNKFDFSPDVLGEVSTATQSVAVIKSNKDSSLYFVLSLEGEGTERNQQYLRNRGELFLSIIDMKLNNGLGGVLRGPRSIGSNYIEKMVLTPHPCEGLWIILHKRDNNEFETLHFVEGEIIDIQNSFEGSNHFGVDQFKGWVGEMRLSKDNILGIISLEGKLEFANFDNKTGLISNAITISSGEVSSPMNNVYYACEFSPSGRYFYLPYSNSSDTSIIDQIDLSVYDSLTIVTSRIKIGQLDHPQGYLRTGIQSAPDGKIYVSAIPGYRHLSTIDAPDEKGLASNFNLRSFSLEDKLLGSRYLPTPVSFQTSPPSLILPRDTIKCMTEELTIKPLITSFDSIKWSTGEISNTISITNSGLYSIQVFDQGCEYKDSILISESSLSKEKLFNDTIKCADEAITLELPNSVVGEWSTGEISNTIIISNAGLYSISIEDTLGCSILDSFEVQDEILNVQIYGDSVLCSETSSILRVTPYNGLWIYNWNSGNSGDSITVSKEDNYQVTITTENKCTYIYSKEVKIVSTKDIDLGADRVLCEGETIGVEREDNHIYNWNTGALGNVIIPISSGLYTISVTDANNCVVSDTIEVLGHREVCDCNVYMSNAFSPSSKIGNAEWHPISNCPLLTYKLEIFDRWGNSVFETQDVDDAWDGTFRGRAVSIGTYTYIVAYRHDEIDALERVMGSITIVK